MQISFLGHFDSESTAKAAWSTAFKDDSETDHIEDVPHSGTTYAHLLTLVLSSVHCAGDMVVA